MFTSFFFVQIVSFCAIIYSNTKSLQLFCENSSLNSANFTDRVIFALGLKKNFPSPKIFYKHVIFYFCDKFHACHNSSCNLLYDPQNKDCLIVSTLGQCGTSQRLGGESASDGSFFFSVNLLTSIEYISLLILNLE